LLLNKHGFDTVRAVDKIKPMQRCYQKNNVILDIMCYHKDTDGTYVNYVDWSEVRKPAKLLENFDDIDYDGKTYNLPLAPDYFEWRYGKDWETPKDGFKGIYGEAMSVTEETN
jgi:hypothetical protein